MVCCHGSCFRRLLSSIQRNHNNRANCYGGNTGTGPLNADAIPPYNSRIAVIAAGRTKPPLTEAPICKSIYLYKYYVIPHRPFVQTTRGAISTARVYQAGLNVYDGQICKIFVTLYGFYIFFYAVHYNSIMSSSCSDETGKNPSELEIVFLTHIRAEMRNRRTKVRKSVLSEVNVHEHRFIG